MRIQNKRNNCYNEKSYKQYDIVFTFAQKIIKKGVFWRKNGSGRKKFWKKNYLKN